MDYKADLHCHSNFSDGTFSPEEILFLAKKNKISGISITDHDTINCYSKDLFSLAENLNLDLLTGIEISAVLDNESVHILGYGFDYESDELNFFLKEVQGRRYQRNLKILEKLSKYKMYIDESELYQSDKFVNATIGRPHIALLMVEKGYVRDFKTAFNEYIKDGGCCYVSGDKYSPEVVIDLLHKVNAKAILAHPHQIKKTKTLSSLLNMKFDGLEVYYGKMLLHKEKKWLRIAQKKGWLVSGGSDFHGDIKPFLTIGSSWIDKQYFDMLKT